MTSKNYKLSQITHKYSFYHSLYQKCEANLNMKKKKNNDYNNKIYKIETNKQTNKETKIKESESIYYLATFK